MLVMDASPSAPSHDVASTAGAAPEQSFPATEQSSPAAEQSSSAQEQNDSSAEHGVPLPMRRLVDFAGGCGHVGVLVAWLFPAWEVVCVDMKMQVAMW